MRGKHGQAPALCFLQERMDKAGSVSGLGSLINSTDSRVLGVSLAVWLLRSGEQWLEGDNPVEEGGGRLCRGWFM